ncbi:hypothetical protein ACF0H5_011357 [Mactra antiquata]
MSFCGLKRERSREQSPPYRNGSTRGSSRSENSEMYSSTTPELERARSKVYYTPDTRPQIYYTKDDIPQVYNPKDLYATITPAIIADKFADLYNHEWTHAFAVLGRNKENSVVIKVLLQTVLFAYTACMEKAEDDLNDIQESFKKYLGVQALTDETLGRLKQERKLNRPNNFHNLTKKCEHQTYILMNNNEDFLCQEVRSFMEKAIELCWLMAIQDPPMFIDTNISYQGKPFDTKLFQPFIKQGQIIEYLVWPTLYLNEGGARLTKGVAKCTSLTSPALQRHFSASS